MNNYFQCKHYNKIETNEWYHQRLNDKKESEFSIIKSYYCPDCGENWNESDEYKK